MRQNEQHPPPISDNWIVAQGDEIADTQSQPEMGHIRGDVTMSNLSVNFPKDVQIEVKKAMNVDSEAGEKISVGEAEKILNATKGPEERSKVALALLKGRKYTLADGVADTLVNELKLGTGNKFTQGPVSTTDISSVVAAKDAQNAKKLAVGDLFNDPNVARAMMDPAMIRTEAHREFVDGIRGSDLYRTYHKDVRAVLAEQVSQIISESETTGTVMDESNKDGRFLQPWARQLYDLVQEAALAGGLIGYEGGPQAVELKMMSDNSPNAYVFGFDDGKPRIHVYDTIVNVFFDNDKGEWISEEAKLMLQSVIAHELGHVKDSPGEWDSWFGILVESSGLLEGHTDGPLFTAAQKAKMIETGRSMAKEKKGLYQFVTDEKLHLATRDVASKLKIPPEKAIATLLQILGIDFNSSKYSTVECDKDGKPTKFGIAQAIFQDSYQLTRAGEIVADRFAFLLQGTNKWTSLTDMMLGTTVNFGQYTTTQQKQKLIDYFATEGYDGWITMQRKQTATRAKNFNLPSQQEQLKCVSHPPSLPRVVLGAEYMNRFSNPNAYPLVVQKIKTMGNPVAKTMEILRVLHHGMHEEITRFVDPRGFDKADATASTMHGFLYTEEKENWARAIEGALKVLDNLISDADLTNSESKVFATVIDALNAKVDARPSQCAIPEWAKTPMEMVTQHLIERVDVLNQSNVTEETAPMIEKNTIKLWEQHSKQLERREAFFEETELSPEEKLAELLAQILKTGSGTGK